MVNVLLAIPLGIDGDARHHAGNRDTWDTGIYARTMAVEIKPRSGRRLWGRWLNKNSLSSFDIIAP